MVGVGGVRVGGVAATAAAGLPAVHDLALVAEVLGAELGASGDEQVLPLGEELVVGGDHPGAQAPVGEVDEAREGQVGAAVVGVGIPSGVRLGGAGVPGYGGHAFSL